MKQGAHQRGFWSWTVSVALAALLLYLSFRGVDWRRLWTVILGAQWQFLAAAVAVSCVSYFFRALRWRILLNAEESLRFAPVFWATMAGYLGNNFLPARAGELIRTLLISSRSSLSKAYVLTTALSERLMDAIALVLWSSLLLLGLASKPRWIEDVSRTMAVIGAVGALAVMILPHTGGLLKDLVGRTSLPPRLKDRLLRLSGQVLLGLSAFHHWGRFGGFTFLTAVIWLVDAGGIIIGARGLGLHLSFPAGMLLIAGLGLGSSLPSTPGYVGIYQFVTVSVLAPFGISKDSALAFSLVSQVLGALVTLAFGLPGLYQAQAKTPASPAGELQPSPRIS